MINEVFSLGGNPKVTLSTYVLDKALDGTPRPLVIVCPGGAFLGCSPSEGEPVALHYNRLGYDAAVLIYTNAETAPGTAAYPQALRDMAESVLIVREHADTWGVDPRKIVVCGFSAGGYVAAMYSCLWNGKLFADLAEPERLRPDAAVLCYPLVDYRNGGMVDVSSVDMGAVIGKEMQVRLAEFRRSSNLALFGACEPTPEMLEELSPICHVGSRTCPTFLWTTFGDGLLDPAQDLAYALELRRAGVPCELHVFQEGFHGLSLADRTSASKPHEIDAHVAHWAELAGEWLGLTFA